MNRDHHQWTTGPKCTTILCKPNGQVRQAFVSCCTWDKTTESHLQKSQHRTIDPPNKVLTAFSKRNPLLSITRATSAKNAKSGENDDRRCTILHVFFFLSNLSSSFNQEPFLFSIHSKRSFVNIYYNYGILFTARVMDQSCLPKRQRRETVL